MILTVPPDFQPQPTPMDDVLIIGAGAAGMFLARRLRQSGLRVRMLEQGGMVASTREATTQAVIDGRHHRSVFEGRALGFGGTTTLWGGQLARFQPECLAQDFAPWPITYAEIEGHYSAVEQELGLHGLKGDSLLRAQLGGESESASKGQDIERFFTAWLPEPNFARLWGQMFEKDPDLFVHLGCTACSLLMEGDRVVGAEAMCEGRRVRFTARQTVLAGSTIGSLRFLLSTAQTQNLPWSDNPRLGAGFQDHLAYDIADVQVLDAKRFRDMFENAVVNGIKVQPKIRWTTAGRASRSCLGLGVSAAFAWHSDMESHLANLKAMGRSFRTAASLSTVRDLPRSIAAVGSNFFPFVVRYIKDKRVLAVWDRGIMLQIQAEQLPDARSRIGLESGQMLPDGLGRVRVEWRVDGREAAAISAFAKAADAYLLSNGVARLRIDPAVERGDQAFLERAFDTNHPSGGAAMGAAPGLGIVGPDLAAFGIGSFHVLSAAVYPSSSHANCTFTLLALANRLADHLKRNLSR
jgi:choline dehydrogenase-like flavoprotein